ncbi:hypothetical protein McpSp1_08170 [Methanocorpusculaceae archaeon Sp1]|nr:hypothetical protein [Methanocorpusculaceae archaeon Sp1]
MKKTYLTAIALVLFLIIGAGSVSAADAKVFMLETPSIMAEESGNSVQIPLMINTASNLDAYELTFVFDYTDVPGTTAKVSSKKPGSPITIKTNDNFLGGSVGGTADGISGENVIIGYIDVTFGDEIGTLKIKIDTAKVYESKTRVTSDIEAPLELEITKGPAYISDITTADELYILDTLVTFSATINTSTDAVLTGDEFKPTWSSSNENIARLTENEGEFELLAEGDVIIKASYTGLASKELPIKVTKNYWEVENTIGEDIELGKWDNVTGATITYQAMITNNEYTIVIPESTRNTITASILMKEDFLTDSGVGITLKGNNNEEVTSLTIDDITENGKITIKSAVQDDANDYYTVVFTGRKLGDVNGDGDVDFMDATEITRSIVFTDTLTPYQKFYANVDGINKVTASDALYIMEMGAGLRDGAYYPTPAYWA